MRCATYISFRHIDLDWADVPGIDIAGYNVYRDTTSNFTPDDETNLIDFAAESSYADTTVTAGITYFYKVIALTGDGVASSASTQASAAPLSSAPAATGDTAIDEGDTYTLTLSANGNPATGWSIYWGDGVTETITITSTAWTIVWDDGITEPVTIPGSAGIDPTHTFDGQADSREILIRYEDADGVFDLDPKTVTIGNVAPTATLDGDETVNEGAWSTLNLSADDPGDNAIVSWTINWGDGPVGQPDIQTIYGNPPTLEHFYATHGTYAITATATDARDGTSNELEWEVEVADVAPIVTATGAATFPHHRVYTLRL
ncbi:MAG: PKD domain-containing protein, partial [Tepidisphaerales bacterium]